MLLKNLSARCLYLEDRLSDLGETNDEMGPEDLPQAGAQDHAWANLCTAFPALVDATLVNKPAFHSPQYLELSNQVQMRMIETLQQQLKEASSYKAKYEALIEDLNNRSPVDATAAQLQTGTKVLNAENKELKEKIAELSRENQFIKKEIDVYKQFADGKIAKQDLQRITEKNQEEFIEFALMRLKKIKVEQFMEKEEVRESAVVELQHKSIKERLAMFEAASKGSDDQPALQKKITVLDEGNVKEIREKARQRALMKDGKLPDQEGLAASKSEVTASAGALTEQGFIRSATVKVGEEAKG